MATGLWKLVWLEIKIFVREPLGFVGSVVIPVFLFLVLGRIASREWDPSSPGDTEFLSVDVPVFISIFIALNAVLSLVTIIAIYREGGILKRLRATPLRPPTILVAHVLVKLAFTAVTLGLMVAAGRRFYPLDVEAPLFSFGLALLLSTWSLLSLGFVIASLVRTARLAQPLGAFLLYPMIPMSGLFAPIEALPANLQLIARALPLTSAVSLLRGIWSGASWTTHLGDVAALVGIFVVATIVASKVFRWE